MCERTEFDDRDSPVRELMFDRMTLSCKTLQRHGADLRIQNNTPSMVCGSVIYNISLVHVKYSEVITFIKLALSAALQGPMGL